MACITIQSGDRAGERIEIGQDETTIGRSPANAIQLDDPSVSGRHCVIRRDGSRFTIEDPGSTNGTRLNGERIKRQGLSNGDTITAGEIGLLIEGDDIEDFHDTTIPPTIVQPPQPLPADDGGAAAPGFQKRRTNRGIWLTLGILIGAAAAGALIWFISQLMQS